MNRELKFRAWTANHWINKGMIYDWQGTNYVESVGFTPWDDEDDLPIMQFTGLKDAKGKDIYEGDIVEFHRAGYPNKPRFIVGFQRGGFHLNSLHPDYDDEFMSEMEMEYTEVIGNQYENAELVTKP